MKCKICGNKAHVSLKSHNIKLCAEDFLDFFERRVLKTIKTYRMFSPDARILVAVSGGKDSLALLHLLHKHGYHVTGYYINLGIHGYSTDSSRMIEQFTQITPVPVQVDNVEKELGISIDRAARLIKQPACSVCGTIKRHLMNRAAGPYDVIATGHNLDDEAATLMGNLMNWQKDYLARQAPVLEESGGLRRKVKPLVHMSEYETAHYTFLTGIDYIMEECPFSKGATSIHYKHVLNGIETSMPGTKLRFLKGFYKAKDFFRTSEDKSVHDLNPCERCGSMTVTGLCKTCRIKDKIQQKLESEP